MTENNNAIKIEVIPGVEAEIVAVPGHTNEEEVAVPMGTASLADIVTGNVPAPTEEEIAAAVEENNKPFKIRAKEKLEEELKKAKDKSFAEPVIEYLLKRCAEDDGLSEDVCQNHKTWEKCFKFIYESARKLAKGSNSCAVRNDVVYEWAEDYYHMDDKAEEEKRLKEAAEKKKKETEKKKEKVVTTKENKARADYDTARKSPADNHKLSEEEIAAMDKKEAPKPKPQPKKNNKDMDGQMDLFSLMGM